MKVIKVSEPRALKKRIECEHCKSVLEFFKTECDVTSNSGVVYGGLDQYSIVCPVCGERNYFNWE